MRRSSKTVRALAAVLSYRNDAAIGDFVEGRGRERAEGEALFRELMKLLWLGSVHGLPSSYPPILHDLWRALVVHTEPYESFCRRHFGRMLHFDPRAAVDPSLAKSDAELEAAIGLVDANLGRETATLWYRTLVQKYPAQGTGGGRVEWSGYHAATKDRPASESLLGALRRFERRPATRTRPRFAIDLGCGSGRDTRELLRRGWRVLAIDAEPSALVALLEGVGPEKLHDLTLRCARFEALERLPRCHLVNAALALPFCPPSDFERVWHLIAAALREGARFAGHFLGDADPWARNPSITSHSVGAVRALLSVGHGFRIERLDESRSVGPSFRSGTKRWHLISVVARKVGKKSP
jgi:SAM-dependent methyltransferase